MASLFVVDDDPSLRRVLSFLLTEEGHDVSSFADGLSAMEALEEIVPDLAVVDINLPDRDGFEICQAIREFGGDAVPIVVLTGRDDTMDRCRMFSIGVDDYLTKPFEAVELLVRVRNRLKRKPHGPKAPGPRVKVGDTSLDLRTLAFRSGSRAGTLTKSEATILEVFLTAPGAPVPVEQLLEALGYPRGLGNPDVARTHIRNLRSKIEERPESPRKILNRPGVGYFFSTGHADF